MEVEDKDQKLSASSRVTKEVGFGRNKKPFSDVAKDEVDTCTSEIVPFTYRNFSQIVSKTPFSVLLNNHNKSLSFPLKLHVVISQEESKDIIEWLPHGRSWHIIHMTFFKERILPLFFGNLKYRSFIRQVNGYGFQRLSQGRDRNCYFHELFLRGMPHLTRNMARPSVSEKVKIHPQCEGPKFHQMSKDYPIPEIPDELVAEYRTAGAFMITCSTDARRSRVHSDNWFASINKQPSPGFRPSENRYRAATTSSVKNSVHIPSSGSNERKTAMLSSVVPEAASVVAQNQAHVHGNENSTTVQPRSSATFIASNYQNTLNMNQQICGNNVAPTYIFTQPALSRNLRPAIGMNTVNTQPALMTYHGGQRAVSAASLLNGNMTVAPMNNSNTFTRMQQACNNRNPANRNTIYVMVSNQSQLPPVQYKAANDVSVGRASNSNGKIVYNSTSSRKEQG